MLFPPDTLRRARDLFPYTQQRVLYFNHAGTSPLSSRVVDAITAYLKRRSEGVLDTYQQDIKMVSELRTSVSRLVNAESPERIGFQSNTSDAINIVASGISWATGDRVLMGSAEFPANVYPYLNLKSQGVELDFMNAADGKVTADMIASHITGRTRLVALSAVQFLSGFRADLKSIGQLCRQRGIVFAVDAIQAVGAVCVDVQETHIDFLAAGAQKWQMGPHGSGFFYMTEELQSAIHQRSLGWLGVDDPWDFYNYTQALASSVRRYEGGSLNMPGLWGMHASIGTLLEFGPLRIESHILTLTAQLMDGLRSIGDISICTPASDSERAGIVTIALTTPAAAEQVFQLLHQRGLTLALREGKLRYSPHFYNSSDDVERAVEMTADALRHG